MKTTTRYSLIAFGFFVFLILAPLLVLYVSGTALNFDSRDTRSTGIFDAKSNPTDATLYIDDKEHSKTPAIARFLNQGEYVFTLKKDGYYDWTKRLPIEAGQVTFAQVGVDDIQLIKKTEPLIIEQDSVSNFKLIDNTVWYAQGNNIVYAPVNDPAKKTVIADVATAPVSIIELRDKKHLLITGAKESVLINTAAKALTALPVRITQAGKLQMATDDTVIYGADQRVYSYNIVAKNTVELRNNNIAFTILGNTGYFASADGVITSAIWNNTNFTDEQLLLNNISISPSEEAELLITDRKELFLKNGKSGLYRVGQSLELVTGQVELVELDLMTNELSFISAGELWFYNFLTSRPQLLTRTTTPTHAFIIRSNIGYGFVGKSTGLEAIETDTRDQQNRYQLLPEKPVWQLAMTDNQKTIIALQDGSLLLLEVRN